MISFAIVTKLIQRLERLGLTIANKFGIARDRLNIHQTQITELQNMQPKTLGLGQVPNWAPTTLNQAKGGVNNTSIMTPKRTVDWANTNVYGPIGEAFKQSNARL